MTATAILFPLHVRLSTWVVVAAFLYLGTRDRRFWLAGVAWLFSFEAVFQLVDVGEGFPLHWPHLQFFVLMTAIAVTIAVPAVLAARGIQPDPWVVADVAALMVAWIVVGFHVNYHNGQSFNATSEMLNEAAKTLLAVAYMLPLWRITMSVPSGSRAAVTRATH